MAWEKTNLSEIFQNFSVEKIMNYKKKDIEGD